ncbi:hypothetical protein PHLCEN_2v13264 [Hermanssonia centrifuga]|uniref:Uncharacterized protein n=1 Tax=Hermanssonia centrifuga TaxID=98765 RepID=A0A2R6NEP2_9APHY|nr:hypothetical protein PHLCEN_2v13264 [Hermanssonia centrifuga]
MSIGIAPAVKAFHAKLDRDSSAVSGNLQQIWNSLASDLEYSHFVVKGYSGASHDIYAVAGAPAFSPDRRDLYVIDVAIPIGPVVLQLAGLIKKNPDGVVNDPYIGDIVVTLKTPLLPAFEIDTFQVNNKIDLEKFSINSFATGQVGLGIVYVESEKANLGIESVWGKSEPYALIVNYTVTIFGIKYADLFEVIPIPGRNIRYYQETHLGLESLPSCFVSID